MDGSATRAPPYLLPGQHRPARLSPTWSRSRAAGRGFEDAGGSIGVGADRGFGSRTHARSSLKPATKLTNRHGLVRVMTIAPPCAQRYGNRLGIGESDRWNARKREYRMSEMKQFDRKHRLFQIREIERELILLELNRHTLMFKNQVKYPHRSF